MEEWILFSGMEPFGDDWRRSAQGPLATYRMGAKDCKLTVENFMPLAVDDEPATEPKLTPEQIKKQAMAMYAAAGCKVVIDDGDNH